MDNVSPGKQRTLNDFSTIIGVFLAMSRQEEDNLWSTFEPPRFTKKM